MDKKNQQAYEDALLTELMAQYAEEEGQRLSARAEALERDEAFVLPEGFEERCRRAEKKAIRRQRLKRIFRRPYSDYFGLEMIALGNLVHFLFVAITTLVGRLDYQYLTLHINIPDGGRRFLLVVAAFLLPAVLTWIFAVLFRLLERKKKLWRVLIRVAAAVALTVAIGNAMVNSLLFEPTAPLASYTEDPEKVFQYDEPVMLNLPATNCPDLIRSIPETAEDVEFSYWYIQIMDYEWNIRVAYTLPEEEYRALRDKLTAQLDAIRDLRITETGETVTFDTVDYRSNLGRANTKLKICFDDATGRVDYTISCFTYKN